MANREKVEAVTDYVFLGSKITVHGYCSREIKKTLALWKESYDKPSQCIKKQRHHFADKDPYSQSYGFSSSHVWMWELDNKEAWVLKNQCFWIVLLEKPLESPLDCKEIKAVNPEGNKLWMFTGRSAAEAILATWCEEPTRWKRPWCWEKMKTKGEESGRGWDG